MLGRFGVLALTRPFGPPSPKAQLSKIAKTDGASPSPSGRRWREAPDEGGHAERVLLSCPPPAPPRPPPPRGRDPRQKKPPTFQNAWKCRQGGGGGPQPIWHLAAPSPNPFPFFPHNRK